MMVISEVVFFVLLVIIILLGMSLLLLIIFIKKSAPEAFLLMKARRRKVPIAFVHYPEGVIRPYIPKIEKHNPESVTPYYIIGDVGIKFSNPDGTKIERWMGDIPVYNYFKNIPEGVSLRQTIAFSQLKDYFKEKNMSIEGLEDVAFYVLTEVERTGDIKEAIYNAQITDNEMRIRLIQFLNSVQANKEEIKKLKLESGVFTYQTAMQALDSTIAYTSANVLQTKAVLETWIRSQLGSDTMNVIKWAIFIFLVLFGGGIFLKMAEAF